jgi:PAS domain S-box-containing protein
MLLPFAQREAPAQKTVILAFRFQTVLVVIALLAFSNGAVLVSSLAFRIAAAYLISNLLLVAIPSRYYNSMLMTGTMLVSDVIFVSSCIYFSGAASGDLYLLYFLAIFMAALTRDLRTTVIVAMIVSIVYLWVSVSSAGGAQVVSSKFLLRIPLFFVTSFFAGFLANQARQRELDQRKAKLATTELQQQLEEIKRMEQKTLNKYRYLYLHHRNIMTSINSGIVVVNKEGVITTFNREAEQITGLSSAYVVGKQASKYTALKPLTDPLRQAYTTGTLHQSQEAVLRTGDGKPLPIGFTTSLLRDEESEIAGAIATFSDLSEVKELRSQVQRSERLAFLGEMAASVAHEIRNPLNSISGFGQLLCERIDPNDRLHKFAEIIVDETTRIEKIVAQTLHFVKDDTIPFESIDFNEVINGTTASLRDKLASRGIAVTLDLNPYLPYVKGNEVQLRQVCTNLVTNAMHALEQGGEIKITTGLDGDSVVATIEDSGPGVPSDIREKIFNPFFTTKVNGTGLGLAVSQKILGDHGGAMALLDKPGRGAVFQIALPVDEAAESPEDYLKIAAVGQGA